MTTVHHPTVHSTDRPSLPPPSPAPPAPTDRVSEVVPRAVPSLGGNAGNRAEAKKRLNTRLLAWLLTGVAACGAGVQAWHTYQVKRHAGAWLRQARLAKEQGNWRQSANYLSRYLALEPADLDAQVEYALAIERGNPSAKARWQAMAILEHVLNRRREVHDVRRHVIRVAMGLGRYADARTHLAVLLKAAPEDGELQHLLAECLEAAGEYDEAATWYEKAIGHAPDQVTSYLRLADLLRYRLEDPERGREILDQLVARNDQSVPAHLCRARYAFSQGSVEQAVHDVRRARELAPLDLDVLLAAAALAPAADSVGETRAYVKKGLETHPRSAELYRALADLELQGERPREAIGCLRRGLTFLPHHPVLLQSLADLLIQQGEVDEAGNLLGRLSRADDPAVRAGYWQARLQMGREQWQEAAKRLEAARMELGAFPEWAKATELALGQCYERLGVFDRQVAAYRRAALLDPASGPARMGLASALLAAGRVSEAVGEYWQAVKLVPVPKGAWTALGRALLVRNLRLPPHLRDWQEVEQVLDRAAQCPAEAVALSLLRADVLVARNQPESAREELEQAHRGQPERVELWIALAGLAEQQGRTAEALRLLDEAGRRFGDRADLYRARVRFWSRREGAEARHALADLGRALEGPLPPDQPAVIRELAEALTRCGEAAEAERLCTSLAERQPADLHAREVLIEWYWRFGDDAGLQRVVGEVRRIEGDGGALWRLGEAARLVLRVRQGKSDGLGPARLLLEEAARQRPDWPRVPLLQAAVSELERKPEQAIRDYQRALELGDRQPGMVQRLVQLLVEQRRFGEADRALRLLEERLPLSGPLIKQAAEVALANQDAARAWELARRAVPPSSRDYRDHVWFSRLAEATGHPAEAKDRLHAALERCGDTPDLWLALVRHLAAAGRNQEAEAAMQQATERLGPERAALALAECQRILGRNEQASARYQAALEARPDDFTVLEKAGGHFLAIGKPEQAEPLLRKLLEADVAAPEGIRGWARRQLTLLLAGSGKDADYQEALRLVAPAGKRNLPVEDQRVRARVLAKRPEHQAEALRLLEASLPQQPLINEEQTTLAELYEAAGDRTRAREQWLNLLAAEGQNPLHLAHYIRCLLRWGEPGEAGRWLTQLELLEPGTPRTQSLRAQVRESLGGNPGPDG